MRCAEATRADGPCATFGTIGYRYLPKSRGYGIERVRPAQLPAHSDITKESK